MNFEQFVEAVEKDVKRTPEVFKRYQERGGSKDEDAAFFLKGEYKRYKLGKDIKHAINAAASCIFMEY